MKKILLSVFILVFASLFCIGAENPRWIGLPIYVYIPEYGNMSRLMVQAFQTWERQSNGLVRFKFVDKPDSANIEVEFVDFVSNCNDIRAVGCTEMLTRKRNYYKSYVTIGTKEYIRKFENKRYVRKLVTRPKEHIYGVMLHEAGHAIGLGHSTDHKSIMYPQDLDSMQYLTETDLQLLYNKYH